ncbi:TIGR03943 family protein [Nakamurella sp. YIM 132087]|uniref:TIGR03943 family protein n=1 Tax=Nakamurella alba TaxID=2665158 RepID=A0A7K1FJS4_9ACTN|nr:TIGR03943 family protein [Nakamurella alba]MTD13503.1 TIGR03943 family protein [Nakamurella alba]
MNKEAQSVIVVLMGGLLLSITISGRYTSYVRPEFGVLLIISGAILIGVGIVSLVTAVRRDVAKEKARKALLAAVPADETALREGRPFAMAEFTGVLRTPADSAGVDGGGAGGDSGGRHRQVDEGELRPEPLPVSAAVVEADPEDHHHGHDHSRSKAPWLILAPVLVLLVAAPPALGADAVARSAGSQAVAGLEELAATDSGSGSTSANTDTGGKDAAGGGGGYAFNDGSGRGVGTEAFARQRPTMQFDPLPTGEDPAIPLREFVLRALYDGEDSVVDTPVTVTGFIAPAGTGFTSGYSIARLVISCCAADANPMQIHVDGDAPLPTDTWVTAVVTAVPDTAGQDNGYVPTVTVTSITPVDQPSDPYEH